MADGATVAVRAGPARAPLPAGTCVRADGSFEWVGDALVAGGSPWRLLRLTPAGAHHLVRWLGGASVGDDPAAGALARRLVDAGLLHPVVAARRVRAEELEVVVPVRDDVAGLATALEALGGDLGVTVVDDGSRDPAAVAAVARDRGATLLRRACPGGPAAARNAGLAATTAPLVAFVDADVVTPPSWLDALIGHFDDPLIAAVAPRVRGPDGPTLRERFESSASPLDLGARPGVVAPGAAVPFVPSAALVARREAVAVGFDESLRTGEDVDLVWRLVRDGWVVRYEPSVEVTHGARPTWRGWLKQRYAYGQSAAPLEARHGDAAAPLRADPRVLATLGLLLAGRPRAAVAVLAWSAASLARRLDGAAVGGETERVARRLAVRGTALAAPGLARAAFRSYGVALLAAAIVLPSARRPVAILAAGATAVRWWRAGRPDGRVGFAVLSVVDDLAYGAGVLAGAVAARRLGALRPRLRPAVARTAPVRRT